MRDWHLRPGAAYLTAGVGLGKTALSAFDAAERAAGVRAANAVRASSFVPPGWKLCPLDRLPCGVADGGAFTPMAYAHASSNEEPVAAAVVVALNADPGQASVITEHAAAGVDRARSLAEAELAADDIVQSRGWSVRRRERLAVQAAPERDLYACALVAVVFVPD